MGFQRYEDQDGDAERHGYQKMRARIMESSTPAEVNLRHVIAALAYQVSQMVAEFERGQTIDANDLALKAIQIGGNIAIVQEMRSASTAPARELVPV